MVLQECGADASKRQASRACVVRLRLHIRSLHQRGSQQARLLVVLLPKDLTNAVVSSLMSKVVRQQDQTVIAHLAVTQALLLGL